MENLTLFHHDTPIAELVLDGRPLTLGRSPCNDFVVTDPQIAPHQCLVTWRRGSVFAYDISAHSRRPTGRLLPLGHRLQLGHAYALRRTSAQPSHRADRVCEPSTESLHREPRSQETAVWLKVGRGVDARRVRVDHRPLRIGTASHNDVVLWDRAISAEHCRIEPGADGLYLRDLDSRNGTYLQGVRVTRSDLRPGMCLRIGRTELQLVDDGVVHAGGKASVSMIAESDEMRAVLHDVQRWSGLPWPVLILGESGVGKEGVAHALHLQGPRAAQPYVALNAGGLTRELVESELFGHARGAFTGAVAEHRGVFEQAHQGTLFLDEIGELPLELQARLLRVLETGELRRVGAERSVHVDVRLLCATHRDLHAMVAAGTFRQDLYFRISRLIIEVPPLRERVSDVEPLAVHFLNQMATEVGPRSLSREAVARLVGYGWPGNVRELRNVLSAAAVSNSGAEIDAVDVDIALRRVSGAAGLDGLDRDALARVVATQNGNIAASARLLGMARSTLRDRLR